MWNDLRFTLRTLGRSPGFTVIAILSLALGIGANTAISSLMYQVAMRPLPVPDPQSLMLLKSDDYYFGWSWRDNNKSIFSYPMYKELRDRNPVFSGLIARSARAATLAHGGNAAPAVAEIVSGNFFDVLGSQPALGRMLQPADDAPGRDAVIVLSYAYWSNQLAADPAILNSQMLMNGRPVLVVGVAPRSFRGLISGNAPDFFAPLSMMRVVAPGWTRDTAPDSYWLNIFGRLKPGISQTRANAALLSLFRSILESELPQFHDLDTEARIHLLAKPLNLEPAPQGINSLRDQWQTPLLVLIAMTGLVLLIACANVANLLIARAAAREREIALRLAVGASRFRLFRQLLVESLTLAAAGGLAGIAIAETLASGLVGLLPQEATGGWISTEPDVRMLAYSIAVALITGVLFGLAPALRASRSEVASVIRQQTGGMSASGSQARVRQFLVAAQICLSMLLLTGAGLFTRSLMNLLRNDPGFRADRLVTFRLNPGLNGYTSPRAINYFDDVQQRLAALPGVQSAAHAAFAPFGGMNWGNGFIAPGTRRANDRNVYGSANSISANYFRTLGIPLLAGRGFNENDRANSPKVMILSRSFAKFVFEDQNPIGRHVRFGPNGEDTEIVGVVEDVKNSDVREKPPYFMYVPYAQGGEDFTRAASFFVWTSGAENSVMGMVRAAAGQLDANVPVESLRTMKTMIGNSIRTDRMIATLAIAFGALAALLAAVGLYGTISYAVTRRMREFGIRMALGAARDNILALVIREVGWLLAVGLGAGLPLSFALARFVEAQLFGVHARDPLVVSAAVGLMAAVALAAALVPARRAMRVQPMEALRHE
jgi:predicted permease